MVRFLFSAALTLAGAGAAMAQQTEDTMDEALRDIAVYDCALDGAQAIYVFQMSADGAIALVGDDTAPVRATETGLSIMTDDGLLEVSDGAYFVYSAGSAESGTCTDITEFAHALYPAMTEAYTPRATGGTVAEQAAAAALADLTVRTQRAEAEAAATEAKFEELDTARETAEDNLVEAMGEIDALKAELGAAMSATDAVRDELADRTSERDALTEKLAEMEALLAASAERLTATEANLDELRALHAIVTEAATDFQGQLGEATTKLTETTAKNRSLVATVAGLNGKITELGDAIRGLRSERDTALQRASAAGDRTVSTTSLTNAAIAKIATLQGRSQNAVRNELCTMLGRGSGC